MNIGLNKIVRDGREFKVEIRQYLVPTFFGDQTNYSVYINGELTILSPTADNLDKLVEDAISSAIRKK